MPTPRMEMRAGTSRRRLTKTGGHQPQNWTGAVFFLTSTSAVTRRRSVRGRRRCGVGGQSVDFGSGVSELTGGPGWYLFPSALGSRRVAFFPSHAPSVFLTRLFRALRSPTLLSLLLTMRSICFGLCGNRRRKRLPQWLLGRHHSGPHSVVFVHRGSFTDAPCRRAYRVSLREGFVSSFGKQFFSGIASALVSSVHRRSQTGRRYFPWRVLSLFEGLPGVE